VRPRSVGDGGGIPDGTEGRDARVLLEVARGETLTNGHVRRLLDVGSAEARAALRRLRDRGLVQQRGTGSGATYVLAPQIEGVEGPGGVLVRPEDSGEAVMALAREGPVTNEAVRNRTGLDRVAALRVLNALVAAGRLERRGSRRGSHYVIPGSP